MKDKECYNFCNGQFVNNDNFFFGTTQCNGLFSTSQYVSGCEHHHHLDIEPTNQERSSETGNVETASTETVPLTQDSSSWIWKKPDADAESGYYRTVGGVTTWVSGSGDESVGTALIDETSTESTQVNVFDGDAQVPATEGLPPTDSATTTSPAEQTVLVQPVPGGSITQVTVNGNLGSSTTTFTNANGVTVGVVGSRSFGSPNSWPTTECSGSAKGKRGCGGGKRRGKRGYSSSRSYETLVSSGRSWFQSIAISVIGLCLCVSFIFM